MAVPSKYLIDALRKLRGDAFVTFPSADKTVRRVERVFSIERESAGGEAIVAGLPAFNSPEADEYTGTQLVEQHVVGGDHQYIEVYQAFETLPGSPLQTKTLGVPDLTPPKFKRFVTNIETNQPVPPTTTLPSALTGNETLISLVQQTMAKALLKTVEEILGSTPPLVSYETDKDKQIVAVTQQLLAEGSSLTAPNAVTDVDTENLGNGKIIETVKTKPQVFPATAYKKEIADPIPVKYRLAVPASTTAQTVAGLAASPTLSSGDLEKSDDQVDEFTHRTATTSRAGVSLPVQLHGQTYIDDLDATIPFTDELNNAGANLGQPNRSVDPLGGGYEEARIYDLSAVQAVLDGIMITYPARQDIHWPSVLVGIDAVWEEGSGIGTADEAGAGTSSGTNVSLNLNTSTQAQSSKHAIPQLVPHIIHPYGDNKSCTDYYFFMPFNFTESDVLARLPSVVAWPNFNPVTRTFILIGQKVAITAHAAARSSQSWSDSGSSIGYSQGGGSSVDIGPSVIEKTIGPVIHDDLGVAGYSNKIETVSVHARANMYPLADSGSFDPTATVNARIEPYTYPATEGDFAIPTGVDVLLHVEASIYQRGKRMAVRARVAHL